MLAASSLVTASGDFFSDWLGLAESSVLLSAIMLAVVFLKKLTRTPSESIYWIIIVIARTAGNTLGDINASPQGLYLGHLRGAIATGAMLAFFVACAIRRRQSSAAL